jgi:hypothetical protein
VVCHTDCLTFHPYVSQDFFSGFLPFRLLPVTAHRPSCIFLLLDCCLSPYYFISFSTSEDSMVSALWKACSEGDLENVHGSLKEASAVDIEIKGTV